MPLGRSWCTKRSRPSPRPARTCLRRPMVHRHRTRPARGNQSQATEVTGGLAPRSFLPGTLQALPQPAVHLAHLGRSQRRLPRAGQLPPAGRSRRAKAVAPSSLSPSPTSTNGSSDSGRTRGKGSRGLTVASRPPSIFNSSFSASVPVNHPATSLSGGGRYTSRPSAGSPTSTTAYASTSGRSCEHSCARGVVRGRGSFAGSPTSPGRRTEARSPKSRGPPETSRGSGAALAVGARASGPTSVLP